MCRTRAYPLLTGHSPQHLCQPLGLSLAVFRRRRASPQVPEERGRERRHQSGYCRHRSLPNGTPAAVCHFISFHLSTCCRDDIHRDVIYTSRRCCLEMTYIFEMTLSRHCNDGECQCLGTDEITARTDTERATPQPYHHLALVKPHSPVFGDPVGQNSQEHVGHFSRLSERTYTPERQKTGKARGVSTFRAPQEILR